MPIPPAQGTRTSGSWSGRAGARRSVAARAFILSAATGLVIGLVLVTSALDSRLGWSLPPMLKAPGAGAVVVGAALIAWAEGELLRTARSTGGFGDAPGILVARGPYRHMRNPIYLGAFILLVGLAGWRASPTLLLAGAAFLPLMHLLVVRVEEPATHRRLGAAYDDYRQATPRWLPRLSWSHRRRGDPR